MIDRHPARLARSAFVAGALVVLALMGSCGSDNQCKVDNDCGPARACVKGMCLMRVVRTLAYEITPMTDSISAQTEIADLSADATTFPVDRKVTVKGMIAPPAPEDESLYTTHEAHVIVSLPSAIPGRGMISLPQTEMADFEFDFDLGQSRLGKTANLQFTPGSNARYQPPISLTTTLTESLALAFPNGGQMTTIRGQLLDATGQPLPEFFAHVLVGDAVVSNLAATDAMGKFTPFYPSVAVGSMQPVVLTMESAKPEEMTSLPRYVSDPFLPPAPNSQAAANPLAFTMPPYTAAAAPTPFIVQAVEKGQSGVKVWLRTEIPSLPGGTAVYQRSAVSDADGLVAISLISDSEGNPLPYQVFLQPPSVDDYRFASKCLSVTIDASQAGDAPPTVLEMDTRFALAGRVIGKNGNGMDDVPVAGAQVTATQIPDASACKDAVAAFPAQTRTDSTGYYLLLVDPGKYRIDVVPPPTSAWPRLTEAGDDAVLVDGPKSHDVFLPIGEVVESTVVDADGLGLPNAMVRIFELACKNAGCTVADAPNLLAEVHTDAVSDGDKKSVGHFRAVLPRP